MFANPASKAIRLSLTLVLLGFQPWFARGQTPAASPGQIPAASPDQGPVVSQEDSRTILAEEVLELAYSPSNLRDSFQGFLAPALDAMKRDGMPDAAREEVRKAFLDWFDQEVKWEEIRPKLVQIYAHDFTEDELGALLRFLQKPLGQRVMAKLPLVMQDGALAGQQYFMSKQDSLNAKLAPIMEKYKSKASGQGGAAAGPSQ